MYFPIDYQFMARYHVEQKLFGRALYSRQKADKRGDIVWYVFYEFYAWQIGMI